MTNYNAYESQKANSQLIWAVFLIAGWSHGSLNKMGQQIFFYLTFGGFGLWYFCRLFTLSSAIKNHNKSIAIRVGLTSDEMIKLGLI